MARRSGIPSIVCYSEAVQLSRDFLFDTIRVVLFRDIQLCSLKDSYSGPTVPVKAKYSCDLGEGVVLISAGF